MSLLQAVVIGLIALIITPSYFFYFDVVPKIVVLLAGTGVTLLGLGIVPRARGRAFRAFSWLLVLNLLSLAISTALSATPGEAAFGTNWRRFGSVTQAAVMLFAWLIASHTAGRPERLRVILRAIALAGGLSAIYGICQYFGWDPILPAAGYHIGEGIWTIVRPPGTLGYVSYFATWLLFVSFLSVALAGMETRAIWRRMALASAALSTVAMFLTGTRAAVLGLAMGLAVGFYLSRRGEFQSLRFSWRVPAVIGLILAAGAGFYLSPAGWQMRSRARWFVEDPSGGNRPTLWRDSLKMGMSKPVQGFGPEIFTAAFPHFESKALAESYPDFLHESPHNIFLDALVSQGLPGLLILCGLCALGLRNGGAWVRAALAAGIVSQFFTVFTMPTALMFYATIAIAVGMVSEPVEPAHGWYSRLAGAPVAVCLVYLAARFAISDHALELAKRGVESGDLPTASTKYEQYRRWNLPGTTSDLWYSRALLGLAQSAPNFPARYQAIAQSGAAAVRATTLAEDPFNAWYNLAGLYASQNDSRGTERCLRSAIAASPNWFKPHWALAQLLRLEHRLDEAETEAATAVELDAGKHAEVTQTLSDIRAPHAQAGPAVHE
ncbi:MAG TPA: O-antigen ligase family protein [Bryobacteraceae bacterium]|nr:O-antigen ligase family protein [Bryobacteraceae bacterium]